MKENRMFLGVHDTQKIVLQPVFYGSPVVVISPVEAPRETCLHVEGPRDHLEFLFPHLVKLVKQTPVDMKDEWGTWTGVEGYHNTNRITLFYHHGTALLDRVLLLEHHFRRDVAFYCDLRLAIRSTLDVFFVSSGFPLHARFMIDGFPQELEQNGSIGFSKR